MSFGPGLLAARLTALIGATTPARLAIALSGGADSAALLHAAAALAAADPRYSLRALHVDHGLTPAAERLAARAAAGAARCAVPLLTLRVAVEPGAGEGPEAAARSARYQALGGALGAGEFLVTAHHREDQAETLLLQLLRGAGLPGLASMPPAAAFANGWLLRPLLDLPRVALTAYARATGLEWCEDPMNADTRYDRAYLRNRLWPTLTERWPGAAATLARAAGHLAAAQGLLDEESAETVRGLGRGPALAIAGLLELPAQRRAEVLRYWLRSRRLRAPPARRLALVERELLRSRGTGMPRMTWPGTELRVFGGLLYAFPPLPPPPAMCWLSLTETLCADLGALGRLRARQLPGAGLAPARFAARPQLGSRAGGERIRLVAGGPRRPLKDLLREARVPPWARGRLPLIRDGQRLAAVLLPGAVWVAAEYAAAAGEAGVGLEWQDAPEVMYPAAPP